MYDITNELSYFLGFFWGDGGMKTKGKATTPKICIVKEDADFLFPIFKKCFDFHYTEYAQEGRKLRAICEFRNNRTLRDFLLSLDYLDKSFLAPTKVLNFLPPAYHKYFWRGYIDADGCFYKKKNGRGGTFSISSSYDQDWSEVFKWLKDLEVEGGTSYKTVFKNNKSSRIEVRYGPDIQKIGAFIYGNEFDDIGLKRKYNKFKEISDSCKMVASRWKGVGFHKGFGRWRTYVGRTFLGWWHTEEEAHQARLKFLASKVDV